MWVEWENLPNFSLPISLYAYNKITEDLPADLPKFSHACYFVKISKS